jgi:hypothetical protein
VLRRLRAYLRQHHLAMLALFVALGGTGAYAAAQLGGGKVAGFNAAPSNDSGDSAGKLASLNGITLRFKSHREDEGRFCTLTAKASARGQISTAYVVQPSGAPRTQSVRGKNLDKGDSFELLTASFDEGAPDVSRRVQGTLTWHDEAGNRVATSVFTLLAESGRCRFQGTLTGAG